MTKGKYLSDLYKRIENKAFNVDEAIKFIVDKKREKFDETIEIRESAKCSKVKTSRTNPQPRNRLKRQ